MSKIEKMVLDRCRRALPGWAHLDHGDFIFDPPKGFSTFTMGVRATRPADPPAVLFRKLEGKNNAILSPAAEREVFELLGTESIAARCYHYDKAHRIEEFFVGRSLRADDLLVPETLRAIAYELHRFHRLEPPNLPQQSFFELLHEKWGPLARLVVEDRRDHFPPDEQKMCESLTRLYSDATRQKVADTLPQRPLTFCHNDTYHGNIMRLDDGRIKLLDFEFSCLNNRAFDFANLFAETVMQHGQPEPPYFTIGEPPFTDRDLGLLIDAYLDNSTFDSPDARSCEFQMLLEDTKSMLPLSDYMYAMAALPLALNPVQKIRFIPYAHQRFARFLAAAE